MRLFQKLLADNISWEDSNAIKRMVARTPPIARPVTELIEIALDTALLALDTVLLALDTVLLALDIVLLALKTDTAILIDISHFPKSY